MGIDQQRFDQLLQRCAELAAEVSVVHGAWEEHLRRAAENWQAAHWQVQRLERSHLRADPAQLEALQPAYQTARRMALRNLDDLSIAAALDSQQPQQSLYDVHELMESARQYQPEPWALAVLRGEFGRQATRILQPAWKAMQADRALRSAIEQREHLRIEANEGYQAFRRAVRAILGSQSEAARRISPSQSARR